MPKAPAPLRKKGAILPPGLKRWLDRVVIPDLVDAWLEENKSQPTQHAKRETA